MESSVKPFLSDRDFDFVIETVAPKVIDKPKLKQILLEDEGFRNSFLGDEKIFKRVMEEEEVFLKISPSLFFQVLLRRTIIDLEKMSYTFEKTRSTKIPVFDTKEVVDLLSQESILTYLAEMLSSFTRIQTYTLSVPLGKGIWEKIHFNDMDLPTLKHFCELVDEEYRLGFYKRIADLCLFILGIFPEYVEHEYRYPFSGQLRPQIPGKVRMSPEEYEREGRKFYQLAATHPYSQNLSEVFWSLYENFQKAKKPLNFIADHYMHSQKHNLFS